MRILRTTLLGLLSVGLLGVHGSVSAQLVTTVSIQDVSSEFSSSFDAGQTIDQSGLSGAGAFGVGTSTTVSNQNMWVTSGSDPNGAGRGVVTYDLGFIHDLSGIYVWNGNEGPPNADRAAQGVEILVASVPGVFTALDNAGGDFTFSQGTGASTYAGFGVDLSGVTNATLLDNVRYVRFNITSNYGGSLASLSEVQFDATPFVPAVPSLFTESGAGFLRDDFTGVVGGEFLTGSQSTQVTKLGIFDDDEDGFDIDHEVAIWDVRTQTIIAQTTLSAGTGDELIGDFRYATLGTPVILDPYSEYRIVSTAVSGSGDPFTERLFGAYPDLTALPDLDPTFSEYVFGVGRFFENATPDINDFPVNTTGTASTIFGSVNFVGTVVPPLSGLAATIPEPTSGLLFVSGLAIAGLWRRRNRSAKDARVGRLGAVLVIMLLMSPTAFATHGGSTPAGFVDAGSAFTVGDSTAALQALFDTGNDIFIPKMPGGDWVLGQTFLTQDNQDILFEDGVVVEGLVGAFINDAEGPFRVDRVRNGSITGGATIRMTNIVPNGTEGRHGIQLYNVDGYTIAGLTLENLQGDGIIVSTLSSIGISQDVTIQDVVIDDAFRNGISVISVRGLLIDNSVIINTSGTSPQAGIDFEPNLNSQRIVDVTIRNTIFAGNGNDGILFAVVEDLEPEPISVLIDNVTLYDNGRFGITLDQDALPNVVIQDTLVINNDDGGFRVTGATSQAIEFSALSGNTGSGDLVDAATLGTGSITGTAPVFVSTDPTNPLYLYLDPSTSTLISLGASDGSFIGARGVAGDFDADADITGFDFLAWQRGESPNNGSADDLAAWEMFFGEVGAPALGSGVGAVPEPSTAVLLFMGVGLGSLLLKRKRLGS